VLILVTAIDGFVIADSSLFILIELMLNLTVTGDLALRIKINGFKKYMRQNRVWNKLDLIIVSGCNLLFLISIFNNITLGEISDELLLLFWLVG